jgi:pimeloyl-ACP methyl ester carboxylesterase
MSAGISVLRVNTRGHDSVTAASTHLGRRWQGAAFEIVDECRLDVLGWLHWAAVHGYRRVLLAGHSLGALKCLYAMAHESLPNVDAILAISAPCLSYSRFRKGFDNDKFFEAIATAESFFQQRRPETLFQAKFPFPLFITGAGFLDKYGPRERYNFLRFLPQLHCPVLMAYGGKELTDSAAFQGVDQEIAAVLPPEHRVRVVTIAGADHIYAGRHAALGGAIVDWVQSLEESQSST